MNHVSRFSILDRQWWEQPYVDLWTINHTLSGVLAAAIALVLGVRAFTGAVLVVLLAIAWEMLEHAFGISKFEKLPNVISDVVAASAGYAVGRWLFLQIRGTRLFTIVLESVVAALVIVGVLGMMAFQRYRKQRLHP